MKKVILIAGHFPPSNLASVHRARLWSLHLAQFGWEPTVLTTHWKYYEEQLDWDLVKLLPSDLKVIHTCALSTPPIRLIGDIGLRGFYWHYRKLCELAEQKLIDFLHITVPSNYSALLGPLIYRRYGVPYGIDYIDPWVMETPGDDTPLSKAWLAARLARWLEPIAVRSARLITGITPGYFAGVLRRNPHLVTHSVQAAMPYGGSPRDAEYLKTNPRPATLFDPFDGSFHLVYAGAMLPQGYRLLEALLRTVAALRKESDEFKHRFRLHFIGTGKSATDPKSHNIRPLIEQHGLAGCANEHPARIAYLDVLNHLSHASGVLIIGSTEAHYSPSKVYQAILSRRPVLALLHPASSAAKVIEAAGAGVVVRLDESQEIPEPEMMLSLRNFVLANNNDQAAIRWETLDEYSARASARKLAGALNEALALAARSRS